MRVVNESSVNSAVIINLFWGVGALNIGPVAAGPAAPVPMALQQLGSQKLSDRKLRTHAQHANTTEVLVSKTVINFRVTATNFSVIMIS